MVSKPREILHCSKISRERLLAILKEEGMAGGIERTVNVSSQCSGNSLCKNVSLSFIYLCPEEHTVFLKSGAFNLSVKIALKMSFSNVWDALVSLVLYHFCAAMGIYTEAFHHGHV